MKENELDLFEQLKGQTGKRFRSLHYDMFCKMVLIQIKSKLSMA